MCSAFFCGMSLARTVDRQGSLCEHRITADEKLIGGTIITESGKIWIDGMNKSGLMAALLNYRKELTAESSRDAVTICPGQLIPALLGSCENVRQAREFLRTVSLSDGEPQMYPHYIIADRAGECIVFENDRVTDDPVGILTNAPSFAEHLGNLRAMKDGAPAGKPADKPADAPADKRYYSSEARFCRLAWLKEHADAPDTAADFMNILDTVSVPRGADGRVGYRTLIKTVMSAENGSYAFCTESDRSIRTVSLALAGDFPLN